MLMMLDVDVPMMSMFVFKAWIDVEVGKWLVDVSIEMLIFEVEVRGRSADVPENGVWSWDVFSVVSIDFDSKFLKCAQIPGFSWISEFSYF